MEKKKIAKMCEKFLYTFMSNWEMIKKGKNIIRFLM